MGEGGGAEVQKNSCKGNFREKSYAQREEKRS